MKQIQPIQYLMLIVILIAILAATLVSTSIKTVPCTCDSYYNQTRSDTESLRKGKSGSGTGYNVIHHSTINSYRSTGIKMMY